MTDVKVTKAMRLAEIKELLADNADIVAFCDRELASIASKAAKAKERAAAKKNETDDLHADAATDTFGFFHDRF